MQLGPRPVILFKLLPVPRNFSFPTLIQVGGFPEISLFSSVDFLGTKSNFSTQAYCGKNVDDQLFSWSGAASWMAVLIKNSIIWCEAQLDFYFAGIWYFLHEQGYKLHVVAPRIYCCSTFQSVGFQNRPKKCSEPFSLKLFYALSSHCTRTCKILCFESFITHTQLSSFYVRETNLQKETSENCIKQRYIIASTRCFHFYRHGRIQCEKCNGIEKTWERKLLMKINWVYQASSLSDFCELGRLKPVFECFLHDRPKPER